MNRLHEAPDKVEASRAVAHSLQATAVGIDDDEQTRRCRHASPDRLTPCWRHQQLGRYFCAEPFAYHTAMKLHCLVLAQQLWCQRRKWAWARADSFAGLSLSLRDSRYPSSLLPASPHHLESCSHRHLLRMAAQGLGTAGLVLGLACRGPRADCSAHVRGVGIGRLLAQHRDPTAFSRH